MAIDDIAVIKGVIERTQKDFSKISNFFIWIGLINLLSFVFEQLTYYFRNVNGYGSGMSVMMGRITQFLPILAYIICYVVFLQKMKRRKNDISTGLIKTLSRCKELIIILPIIVVLLMTGILMQRKWISMITTIYSIIYFVLFVGMKEVVSGAMGGSGTLMPVSSVSIKIIMTCGMIALGLYLKRGVREHGDKFNTGSISDET